MLNVENQLFAVGGPLYKTPSVDTAIPALSRTTDGINWITVTGQANYSDVPKNYRFETIAYDSNSRTMLQTSGGNVVNFYTPQLTASYLEKGGSGGSGGAYASWYIPRPIFKSNSIIVRVGAGGLGGTINGNEFHPSSSVGGATTISVTVAIGLTCDLIISGGGATPGQPIGLTTSDADYSTAGRIGVIQVLPGIGNTAPMQNSLYQPTGGGGGAGGTSFSGGFGGPIVGFGSMYSGNPGQIGIAVSGVPAGSGGGGGSGFGSGNGGNGVRGGGGGGGAGWGNNHGFGGNGGDGYVRISWW